MAVLFAALRPEQGTGIGSAARIRRNYAGKRLFPATKNSINPGRFNVNFAVVEGFKVWFNFVMSGFLFA